MEMTFITTQGCRVVVPGYGQTLAVAVSHDSMAADGLVEEGLRVGEGIAESRVAAVSDVARSGADRCPGIVTVHRAADGGLARVRLPGGLLGAGQLRVLASAAAELGDGQLELTSRANVQVRGLADSSLQELSQRLYDAGLLPSLSHERVRNLIASPLSGLDGLSRYDVLPIAAAVNDLLCATPVLADLPGRFLFVLDDGRGDVSGLDADVGIRAVDDRRAELILAGSPAGVLLPYADVPATLIAAAEAFLAERTAQSSAAWRLAELTSGPDRILARLGLHAGRVLDHSDGVLDHPGLHTAGVERRGGAEAGPAQVGVHRGSGGAAVVAAVPLGRLTAGQALLVADLADQASGRVRVTPWRSVVIPDVVAHAPVVGADGVADGQQTSRPVAALERAGLVVEAGSAWIGMTGCAGRPGCGKALADVRADAARALPVLPAGRAVHWSGCDRRCGRPAGSSMWLLRATGMTWTGCRWRM